MLRLDASDPPAHERPGAVDSNEVRMASMFTKKPPGRAAGKSDQPDVAAGGRRASDHGPPAAPWTLGTAPMAQTPGEVRVELEAHLRSLSAVAVDAPDRVLLDGMLATLEDDTLGLPQFPDTPIQLDEVLRAPDPRQRDVLHVIERDPELIRVVWAHASGSRFSGPPSGLEQAITRVGLDEVWRLGVKGALEAAVFTMPGHDAYIQAIRQRAHVTAEVAAWLVHESRGPHYLSGLLLDVGELLVHRFALGTGRRRRPASRLLQDLLRTTHTSWSFLVAHRWGLGAITAIGMGYHHDPDAAPPATRSVARIVRAADIAARTALEEPGSSWKAASAVLEGLGLESEPTRVIKMASVVAERQT